MATRLVAMTAPYSVVLKAAWWVVSSADGSVACSVGSMATHLVAMMVVLRAVPLGALRADR